MIPEIIRATGTFPNHSENTRQHTGKDGHQGIIQTAILGTAYILQKVLM